MYYIPTCLTQQNQNEFKLSQNWLWFAANLNKLIEKCAICCKSKSYISYEPFKKVGFNVSKIIGNYHVYVCQ